VFRRKLYLFAILLLLVGLGDSILICTNELFVSPDFVFIYINEQFVEIMRRWVLVQEFSLGLLVFR
jgi:hypothetical protein